MGEKGAYTAGWMYFLNWATTGIADITAVATYAHYWGMFTSDPQWVIALIALAVVLTVNLISVKFFGELEFWFAIVKVGGAGRSSCAIGIFLMRHPARHRGADPRPGGGQRPRRHLPERPLADAADHPGRDLRLRGCRDCVGVAAGETKNPEKIMPRRSTRSCGGSPCSTSARYPASMLLPYTAYSGGREPLRDRLRQAGYPRQRGGVMNLVVLTAAMSSLNSGPVLHRPHPAVHGARPARHRSSPA